MQNRRATAQQCASRVLLVRPARFGHNADTASTNRFQQPAAEPDEAIASRACAEFDGLCAALRSEGVRLCIVDDSSQPHKPDAVFPNNWVSFHADGTVVLYPMQAPNRRPERRLDIIEAVARELGFRQQRLLDFSVHEREGRFLEGTGSLVLDQVARVVYACRSPRTDPDLVRDWAQLMGYEAVVFDTTETIYHTNVLMCIGTQFALICSAVLATADRTSVLARLGEGRELIEIEPAAMRSFAANMLELAVWDEAFGDYRVLVMSAAARAALPPEQFARLSACSDSVLAVPVPTIEAVGGGGVRCMLAEVPESTA
jgi:hypothetical protein